MTLENALRQTGWKYMFCDNTSRTWDVKAVLTSGSISLQEGCLFYETADDGEPVIEFRQYCLRKDLYGITLGYNKLLTTI